MPYSGKEKINSEAANPYPIPPCSYVKIKSLEVYYPQGRKKSFKTKHTFFHPDCTVGSGI
jgi:hypothetical protein